MACPEVCPVRAVMAYIHAAEGLGWDLSAGHLFPVVLNGGGRGSVPLTAVQMTSPLQGHLRQAGLSPHYTMHSFRVGGSLTQSLEGTAVDAIMRLAGWKTESVAVRYIGPTMSAPAVGSKRGRGQA